MIDCPTSAVEVVTARITVEQFNAVILVSCRPGLDAVQSAFYEELTDIYVRYGCHLPSAGVCGGRL